MRESVYYVHNLRKHLVQVNGVYREPSNKIETTSSFSMFGYGTPTEAFMNNRFFPDENMQVLLMQLGPIWRRTIQPVRKGSGIRPFTQ